MPAADFQRRLLLRVTLLLLRLLACRRHYYAPVIDAVMFKVAVLRAAQRGWLRAL